MPSGRSECRWAPVRAYVLIANDDGIAYVGEAQNGFQNMMLLDKWRENEDRVRQAGTIALKQAREAGVPAYYRDPSLGEGVVKEMPDGNRVLIGEAEKAFKK